MIAVRDDAGREVVLEGAARRIVSLVPSLTETVFGLGRGDAVVGVTRYCTQPAGTVERIERVGGTKNPNLDRICALRPDLVLINAEENRKEDFEALQRAGVTVFVTFSHRAGDVPDLLRRLGELTGARARAQAMAGEVTGTLAEMQVRGIGSSPRVFCPIWKNPWMAFNRDTYAHDVLSIAGGENICADRAERYPAVTLEEVAAAMPEVIFLPSEPYVFAEKDLAALAPLGETPAMKRRRIRFIDGAALSWYGARTAAGLRHLRMVLASTVGAPQGES